MVLGLSLVLLLAADDLTPDKAAKVQRDRDKAMDAIAKKYGNKKSSELSSDERREIIREQRDAENTVLEKNGVDPKEFARYEARMSLSDRAATKSAKEDLDKKEEAEKKAAADKAKGEQPIQVQRGFSDSNPVTLEDKPADGQPIVEKGLPQEARDDYEAAGKKNDDDMPVQAPEKKKGKGKK